MWVNSVGSTGRSERLLTRAPVKTAKFNAKLRIVRDSPGLHQAAPVVREVEFTRPLQSSASLVLVLACAGVDVRVTLPLFGTHNNKLSLLDALHAAQFGCEMLKFLRRTS